MELIQIMLFADSQVRGISMIVGIINFSIGEGFEVLYVIGPICV